jgi:hypothetical protein
MNIKVLIIIVIILILLILISTNKYLHGLLIGKIHSNKIKSNFTYINMNKYSKLLDSRQFVNGYLDGIIFIPSTSQLLISPLRLMT